MQIQNKPLIDSISVVFDQDYEVSSQGRVAIFTVPSKETTGFEVAKEYEVGSKVNIVWAILESGKWGEIIQVNCPCCNDRKHRLAICHLSLTDVQHPSSKNTTIRFGLNAHCYNEKCEITKKELFKERVYRKLRKAIGSNYIRAASFEDLWGTIPRKGGSKLKKIGFGSRSTRASSYDDAIPIPKPALPLSSPNVPERVIKFIRDERGFDPEMLYSQYGVLYAGSGAVYGKRDDGSNISLFDGRILAPIYQGGRYAGWQGRGIGDVDPKYFNPGSCSKSEWLYNKDYAKFFDKVLITEGITNVWAFGSDVERDQSSVAGFGKSISEAQMDAMAALWGFQGIGILMLDPDAAHYLPETVEEMLKRHCFGCGMAVMLAPWGMDAADLYRNGRGLEMQAMFDAAVAKRSFDASAILSGFEEAIAYAAENERRKRLLAEQKRNPFKI